MVDSTRPELAGGGMWIGFSLLERFSGSDGQDRFVKDLVALFERHGVKAEAIDVRSRDDHQRLRLGVYVWTP